MMTEKKMRLRAEALSVKYRNMDCDQLAKKLIDAEEKYRRAVVLGDGTGDSGENIRDRWIYMTALRIEAERRDHEGKEAVRGSDNDGRDAAALRDDCCRQVDEDKADSRK